LTAFRLGWTMLGLKRFLMLIAGLLGGLVLVEAGLQGVKLAVSMGDAGRTTYDVDGDGVRILCLGACYTIGLGTAPEASYPMQLEQRLDRLQSRPGDGATVFNGGVRGKSIDYFAAEIEPLLEEYQPDIIVVGVNHRTSLDPSPPIDRSVLDRLLLPRVLSLVLEPPAPPEGVPTDPIAQEVAVLEAAVRAHPDRPPLRKKLARLYSQRGDHAAALAMLQELVGDRPPPAGVAIKMFRHAAAVGRFELATEHLDAVRAEPAFVERMRATQGSRDEANEEDGRDPTLHRTLDQARIAMITEDWSAADRLLTDVLARDPETAEAWYLLGYLDHVLDRAERRPSAAFLEADRSFLTPEIRAFERAFDAHLGRMVSAAEREGATVVVHTLAATVEQIPVIHRVAHEHGVPVIDVQTALRQVEDPDPLFLPANQLRFSEAGNAWLAEQVHLGLAEAGLVAAP
jgi:Flp pilus assembly protein TadD